MIKTDENTKVLQFETGAVRESQDGKGRCDLLPARALQELYDTAPGSECSDKTRQLRIAYRNILQYMNTKDIKDLIIVINRLQCAIELEEGVYVKNIDHMVMPASLLELSKHFQEGAKKYGDRNWEKGMPKDRMLDSGLRHLLKHLADRTDESHLVASLWNFVCLLEYELREKEEEGKYE